MKEIRCVCFLFQRERERLSESGREEKRERGKEEGREVVRERVK